MANAKRKAVEDYILKYVDKISGSKENVALYRDLFAKMTDKEFDNFMVRLKNKEINLSLVLPTGMDQGVSVENNYKVAKELGVEFFSNLHIGQNVDTPAYTTPNKFLVCKLPVRRAAQLLSKKISIPSNARQTDYMTGQVSSDSRASSLTLPELQVMIGIGCDASIKELLKARGGDLGELAALNKDLYNTGEAKQQNLATRSKGVVSTATLSTLFLGMHIRSTTKKREQ